jgi:hypothetical protein
MCHGGIAMKKLTFVWIDDQKQRVEDYRASIEAGINEPKSSARIEIIEVKKNVLEKLDKWTAARQNSLPNLIIIDHIFNLVLPFGLKGSSVAHLLRSNLPSVPIVCVTAKLDSQNAFDQEDLSEYTAIFPYTLLADHIDDLYAIARDFRKLTSSHSDIRSHLVACLKAPERDKQDLLRVLPEEFLNQRHSTTEHHMGRWVYNVLMQRPGFLYDELHLATLLGLNETGFKKVESLFAKALYRGIFATSSKPRWWVSEVRRLLFTIVPEDAPDSPQLAGRILPGIKKDHYSKCYVSKKTEPPPDVVLFTDATPNAERRVAWHEFAMQHPKDSGVMPGFEIRLVLRKKKM